MIVIPSGQVYQENSASFHAKTVFSDYKYGLHHLLIRCHSTMVRVAVLGGSKGCSRAMVVQGLENNQHQFKLLIRNPDTMEYTEEQKSTLTIVKGDALDPVSVRQTVQDTDVIVFSVGSAFDMKTRKMVSPGLCHDSMKVLLDVLKEMDQRPKRLVVVSTTGLDGMKEVPYLFQPMYRYLLHDPHMDKAKMEELVDHQDVMSDWIVVRPSLLTDGKLVGKYRAKVGISGYTISRQDVGHFLLNQCIEPDTFIRKKVVVTF